MTLSAFHHLQKWLFLLLLLVCARPAFATNLNISNAQMISQDTSADTITFQFDISWDRSWRDSDNYDAVWVFIKYTTNSIGTFGSGVPALATNWSHTVLKTAGTNPSGFSPGSGTALEIVVPSDKRGLFLQRSAISAPGSVSTTSVQVVWDYAANGLSDTAANTLRMQFKVFGIEMVYIPQGGFYIGDGSDGTNGEFEWGGVSGSKPASVNSEGELFFGTSAAVSSIYYNSDRGSNDFFNGTIFTVAESYPKGFHAFYAMKYEISQGQYVNFLNTLSRPSQKNRTASDPVDAIPNYYVMSAESQLSRSNRNTITAPSASNGSHYPITFVAGRPYRAMNYMSWMDLAAFADWAALRPMSEIEYEKLCRGPLYPVDGEYAWGSTAIIFFDLSGAEDGTEYAEAGKSTGSPANYNNNTFANGDGGTGPWRVGAAPAGQGGTYGYADRANNASGYYGNADLSGNVWERTVTVGNSAGLNFAGTHGDGVLTEVNVGDTQMGYATNVDWPGIDATIQYGVTGALGGGQRGGSWATTSIAYLQISNRERAGVLNAARDSDFGGRLVRTAP